MIRTIDGRRYLMRDLRPVEELRQLYTDFCYKYGDKMDFHTWLADRGKVQIEIKRQPISTRLPSIVVEYDSRNKRVQRTFDDAYEARRFYSSKLKDGKNPTVKKGN